jgi:hypothetical protein
MIFIPYSHVDERWCKELRTMATPLKKYGGVRVVSDKDVPTGADWRLTIQKFLVGAEIAVLLVSRHFLDSEFIMNVDILSPRRYRSRIDSGCATY